MRTSTLIALAAFLRFGLSAARLILRDGTVINARFINGSTHNIVFQDETGMRRRFDLNQIQSIDFTQLQSAFDSYGALDLYGHAGNDPYNQYNKQPHPQYNAPPQHN